MASSPATTTEDAGSRRRSGRVVKKPDFLAPEATATAKRKRSDADDQPEDDADSEEDDEDDDEDAEPDEEELKAQRSRKTKSAPKKPASKKPKTNGVSANLPIRSTAAKSRPRKKKAQALDLTDAEDAGGLYTEVFARGHTLEDVVTEWHRAFSEHEALAVADLINFVLRCSGCDMQVSEHDIEDPDGAPAKIADLQEEFQAQNISEYPIISKTKGSAAFKTSVIGFFNALIKGTEASGVLFTNVELVENVQVWLGAMSAASNRAFRHTATVASLAILTAFCEVGRELQSESAKALRHSESEKKSKKVNKGRVSGLQEEAQKAQQRQALLDTLVKDWFETIFIHRYRDVDPRIRVDCAQALGDWIVAYPDVFFDGAHLRYLGWVLSDSHAPARLEVIKQLQRLYGDSDNWAGLKSFTERFRARIVEMAVQDHEPSVRSASVELLDSLREAGFLEPDDIDAVGRLIFDSEARVRKAVVGFFAESVNDSYESKIDELGGEEQIDEELPEDSSERPGKQWLRIKSLAEMLDSYDAAEGDDADDREDVTRHRNYRLPAGLVESRFIIATTSLYHDVEIIQDWEALAAYLLYDTSDSGQNGVAEGIESRLKDMIKLSEKEEIILLEVLNASLKGQVEDLVDAASDKRGKKTKKEREDLAGKQETTVRQLANLVPRLLKRYGDAPQTASAVLRLDRIVNLEAFADFHQDSTAYTTLLDDINKQFLSHGNEEVLTEASRALLRAKDYQDLGEVTGEKIDELWEETISTFTALTTGQELTVRGGLRSNVIDALSKTVARLERLSCISNPFEHLETVPQPPKTNRKSKTTSEPKAPLESLIELISQAVPSSSSKNDSSISEISDTLANHAASTVSFYMLWSISTIKTSLENLTESRLEHLATNRDAYINALVAVISSRPASSDIVISTTGLLLDIYTIASTLRQIPPSTSQREDYLVLALEMDAAVQKAVLTIFTASEDLYARLTNKTIDRPKTSKTPARVSSEDEEEDINAEPIDEDSDSDSDSPLPEAADSESKDLSSQLLAEQKLCELASKIILACLGGMMDSALVRKRLDRNRNKLGHNYKEVIKFLDSASHDVGKKGRGKGRATAAVNGKKNVAKAKSKEIVVESEDEDEGGDAQDEEDDEVEEEVEEEEVPLVEEDEEEAPEEEVEDEIESVLGD